MATVKEDRRNYYTGLTRSIRNHLRTCPDLTCSLENIVMAVWPTIPHERAQHNLNTERLRGRNGSARERTPLDMSDPANQYRAAKDHVVRTIRRMGDIDTVDPSGGPYSDTRLLKLNPTYHKPPAFARNVCRTCGAGPLTANEIVKKNTIWVARDRQGGTNGRIREITVASTSVRLCVPCAQKEVDAAQLDWVPTGVQSSKQRYAERYNQAITAHKEAITPDPPASPSAHSPTQGDDE